MPKITLDEALSTKLHELCQVVELCDPSGRILGRFIPLIDLSEWEPISPDVSEEELDRREKSTEWYTTAEVLAHLERLKCSPSPVGAESAQRIDNSVDASGFGAAPGAHGGKSRAGPTFAQ